MNLLPLLLSAIACSPFVETEACLHTEDGTCPPADEVDEDALNNMGWCETKVRSVEGEAELVDIGWDSGMDDQFCCYPVVAKNAAPNCAVGRPYEGGLMADGEDTKWARAARAEHAAVASFNRLALELMALGAPLQLIREVQQAALDEVEHASMCAGLAGIELGPFPIAEVRMRSRVELARDSVREGCLVETCGAWLADEAARVATGRERAVLTRIAGDEARHAALSWKIVAWLMTDMATQAAVAEAFAESFEVASPFGAVDPVELDRFRATVLDPAIRALRA
ncbi:MAG: hypothetical protein GY913_22325 [Proteobacteria bacterium]|nr:hypothetical protein [Pseudomonadota bacterium]MCP4919648.1 hypothetical protein [Pseudomonadota bacterium]